jgi:hypothetical protein
MADLSVGFVYVSKRPPTPEEAKAFPGAKEVVEEAILDEVAIVLRGAVPGAQIQSTRGGHVVRRRRDAAVPAAVIDAGRKHTEAMQAAKAAQAERRRQAVAAAGVVDELLEVGAEEWMRRQGIEPEPEPSNVRGTGRFVAEADVLRLGEEVHAGRMTEAAAKAELRRLARP